MNKIDCPTKFIFVTGGVVSGLGKGITGSSLGMLLKACNLSVFMQKMDPYLNIDPGTMSPFEHGEVYVTADGGETDLDLGHYERFIDVELSKASSTSAGRIYSDVLAAERKGTTNGKTVQVVPHITDYIKAKVYQVADESQANIIITEIGGTVGDIESLPFVEAIRQIRMEKGKENVMFIHVGLLPYIASSQEYKTKPIQHSVKEFLSLGVQPDVVITRSDKTVSIDVLNKISLFCNIPLSNVIQNTDSDSIYKIPLELADQNFQNIVIKHFNLEKDVQPLNIKSWKDFVKKIDTAKKKEVTVSLIGKYIDLPDAYLSVIEALKISGYQNGVTVKINWIQAEKITEKNIAKLVAKTQGILVPGGFGSRGVEGMIIASKYAREHKIPYLGICLGMQIATISMVRDYLNKPTANSTEFDPATEEPVFDFIHDLDHENLGGTLRLGTMPTKLTKGSLAHKLYNNDYSYERHRHRYEFNPEYQENLEAYGVRFTGVYEAKNLIEIIEIPKHPFFIASQYHPEFTARPNKPNPMFEGFVKAMKKA